MKFDYINYARIGQAQTFYRAAGYGNVEVPWIVTPAAVVATLPPKKKMIQSNFGCHVGSAEQGFIQMMIDGTLEPGKWQATGPCFREEEEYNELTRQTFFKTELIWYMPEDEKSAYEQVMNDALQCFFAISDGDAFNIMQTDEGVDIFCNGVELGSYGVRKMGDHLWVFGTGIAEPRFTMVVQKGYSFTPQTPEVTDTESSTQTEFPLPNTDPDNLLFLATQ